MNRPLKSPQGPQSLHRAARPGAVGTRRPCGLRGPPLAGPARPLPRSRAGDPVSGAVRAWGHVFSKNRLRRQGNGPRSGLPPTPRGPRPCVARGGGGSRWEPPDLPAARWQGTECGPLRSRWGHRSPLLSAPFTAQGESATSQVSADGLSYVPQCPWVALSRMLVSVAGTHLLVPPLVNATEDGSAGQPTVGGVRGRLRRCHWPTHRDPRLGLCGAPPTPDAR